MDLLSVPDANPNLPPKVKEAREMLQYAAIFFLVAALLYGLWGLWDIMWGLLWSATRYGTLRIGYGVIRIVFAVVAFILKGKLVEEIITPVDQGRYDDIEDKLMIYAILGFIFGLVISGVLILLGYMKLKEVDSQANVCPTCRGTLRYVQQYQKWYCDNCGDYKMPIHPASSSTPPPPSQGQQQYQQQPPEERSQQEYQTPPPPEDQ